jgi:hypothetical protein
VKKESVFIFGVLFVLFFSFVGQNHKVYVYLFDNADFTEKHCVNKENPEKKCNGACQLKDSENNNVPAAPNPAEYQIPVLFLSEIFVFETVFVVESFKKSNFFQCFDLLRRKDKVLVPPPNCLVS